MNCFIAEDAQAVEMGDDPRGGLLSAAELVNTTLA
jgi:hypothetical protein